MFVALEAPAELVALAVEAQRQLAGVPGVELVDPENLHLTIIPPWDERNVSAVLRDFSAIAPGPVALRVTGIGYGPHGRTPGLAWLTCDVTPEVERLWLQTWRALWSQDPTRETFPHLTIAYVPEGVTLPQLALPREASAPAARVSLFEALGAAPWYRVIGGRDLST